MQSKHLLNDLAEVLGGLGGMVVKILSSLLPELVELFVTDTCIGLLRGKLADIRTGVADEA